MPEANLLQSWGTLKLIESYAGDALTLRRDDTTDQDIAFDGDNLDIAAVNTFRDGGTEVRAKAFLDQSGNSLDTSQATYADMFPVFEDSVRNGIQEVDVGFGDHHDHPAGFTASGQAFTSYMVFYTASNYISSVGQGCFSFGTNSADAQSSSILGSSQCQTLRGGSFVDWDLLPRNSVQVVAIVGDSAEQRLYYDGQSDTVGTAAGAASWVGGAIGEVAGIGYNMNGRILSQTTYTVAHSDAEVQANIAILMNKFNVNTDDYRLIMQGNSIVVGTGDTYLNGYTRRVHDKLLTDIKISNFALAGQLLTTQDTDTAKYSAMYTDAPEAIVDFYCGEPTNDIEGRASGTIVGYGTTLYNTNLLSIIADRNTDGYDTLYVPTIIERAWSGSAQDIIDKEGERQAYNTLVRDNAIANGYEVIDLDILTSPNFYADSAHPSFQGHPLITERFVDDYEALSGDLLDYIPVRWLDSSVTSRITESSNLVSQQDDLGCLVLNATQPTGADQPLTNTNTLNDLNVITFDGSTDHYDIDGLSGWKYLFLVLKGDTSDTTQSLGSQNLGTGVMLGLLQDGNGSTEIFRGCTVPNWYKDGTAFSGSTRGDAYDFVIDDSAHIFLLEVTAGNNAINTLLGAGSGFVFKGDFAEAFFGLESLTTSDLNDIGNSLATKYDLTWSDI
jgi:hypothetical protein